MPCNFRRSHTCGCSSQESLQEQLPVKRTHVPIILEKHEGTRDYFITPLYPITLDTYPSLEEASSQWLWDELSQALKSLHNFGYAYMDIKAANICSTTKGKFILIDLDSVVKFNLL